MGRQLKRLHKNIKFFYYVDAIFHTVIVPAQWRRKRLTAKLAEANRGDIETLKDRVTYYNKLRAGAKLSKATALSDVSLPKRRRVYYFDSQRYLRYFQKNLCINFIWGDVTFVPEEPSLVKSRPIAPGNENSVLLNLDKARHFNFIEDSKSFQDKKDMLIGRANVTQPHRIRFYQQYFDHPMCDLGQINRSVNPQWIKEKLSIAKHLDYKFILSLEGNDVATNLKWVMSSNSLAVMPTPRFETWFMEGRLIPDYHYVHIKDDYSDLVEKLSYYIEHTEEAIQIIRNAHEYIDQFRNKKREDLISLLVLEKYFYCTGQLEARDEGLSEIN